MAEHHRRLQDTERAVVFGRTKINREHNWVALIGEVTIYSATQEGIQDYRNAIAKDNSLRSYPYVDAKGMGKVIVKPISPGIFLDISFPHIAQREATVIVVDPNQSFEEMREKASVVHDIFLGIDEGVDERSSLILSSMASQKLYDIQEEKRKA